MSGVTGRPPERGIVVMAARVLVPLFLAGALGAGAWLAHRARGPQRRDLDALVTVGGDLARDAISPALDLTRLGTAEEMELGRRIDAEVRAGLPAAVDPAAQAYLDELLASLSVHVSRPGITYSVLLLRSSEVRAFSVAGGRVYLTEGLLGFVRNEAELAAVLGHEIAHIDRRHCVERLQFERAARRIDSGLASLARLGYEIMLRGFSEEQELAADGEGALLAARTAYDAWRMSDLLNRIGTLDPGAIRAPTRDPIFETVVALPEALRRYAATHPPAPQRLEAVRRALAGRPDLWRDAPRYVGRANLEERRTKSKDPRADEWVTRRQEPDR
ncbi:MAG TPA: M48 family metalloprotease [Candidatus Polarisedimenticolia bacterium]